MNEEYMKALEKRIESLEVSKNDFEVRVTALERRSDVSNEQIKMIFNILNEIKGSIAAIANKLDRLEDEPSQQAKQFKMAMITALGTGILGVIIGLIFNK